MDYEIVDCIDCGTKYCPCHLALSGDCILCSHLQGNEFCDCKNWHGVCIYKELFDNGFKAKEGRKTYTCQILKKNLLEENLLELKVLVSKSLAESLNVPGAYVFMRSPSYNLYYDTPISVMDVDDENNVISFIIELKGIKTKSIANLNEHDDILLRAPYWNGILGLKNLNKVQDQNILIISRGIGFAPMMPVLKKLYARGNNISIILDKGTFKTDYVEKLINNYNITPIYMNTIDKGELPKALKDYLKINKFDLIHIDGPDILISNVIIYNNDSTAYSCCNNAKMCCGEGVCGACTSRYKGHIVKRLCKVQVDPKFIFEGRRLI